METTWKLLLLAAVATVATAQSLSYEEAVVAAVTEYNRESDADALFWLLELKPQERPLESRKAIPVNFTIQETVCPKVENRSPDQCDFKEGGVVRNCSGTVLPTQEAPVVTLTCDRVKIPTGSLPHPISASPSFPAYSDQATHQTHKERSEEGSPNRLPPTLSPHPDSAGSCW
uniref:Uncharacterized protein n=1 Tax=Ornithorhynchus anatinus TaxID=9258 RepID=F7D165_ORNAN